MNVIGLNSDISKMNEQALELFISNSKAKSKRQTSPIEGTKIGGAV